MVPYRYPFELFASNHGLAMTSVLVVDDDPFFREVAKRQLEHQGFQVFDAGNGEETIKIFGEESIDIVVLDYMLPGMKGDEVARRLISSGATCPIIFVSGADPEILAAIDFNGELMAKPLSFDRLGAAIRRLTQTDSEHQAS
ncbi:Response regulator receiver domain-containing protein [Pseudobacteriovorax antillogorgiicola]|uniref:Response regulator receiver domain-containing protein n=2 Tax=Pseudobacteriovorax antillogorgiicola TaxID=1513793 RepID=A0A1Y6CKT4_9BACT|nr:response regulator receiver domain-containing protein [Pseudobacteriovorax antillogorgiicola]SMF60156.1 Response regulator receiver domain-containing protein [Pseudobacteriovorax antillogorgiicola]